MLIRAFTFRWGFQILLILSTQAMGFGAAGMLRRFLIYPAAMIWPTTLVTTTVMNSLHDHRPADPAATNGWKIGRYKFFLIVAGATFCYEWFPTVIAQFLSVFTFACWIAPNNVLVNQILGGQSGKFAYFLEKFPSLTCRRSGYFAHLI